MNILSFIGGALVLLLALHFARTLMVEHSPGQQLFLAGHVPSEKPDGLYRGTAVVTGGWKGKKFFADRDAGINLFGDKELYPFKTYTGPGIRDHKLQVYKIDYNIPGNPWWLRPVLDEIVETESGKFLGKLHVRLIPGIAFSLAFFRLEK